MSACARPTTRRPARRAISPCASRARAARPDGNRIVDVLTSLGGTFPSRGDPFRRDISMTPGTTYQGRTTDWGVSLQVDWDLGGATLTSITAFRGYKSISPSDTDYTNVDILRRDDDDQAFRDFRTFTQELRLQGSAFGGFLDWLVGGYYASEDLHVRDNLPLRQPIWRLRLLPPGRDRQPQSGAAQPGRAGLSRVPPRRLRAARCSAFPAALGAAGSVDRSPDSIASARSTMSATTMPIISRTAPTGRSSPTISSTSPTI